MSHYNDAADFNTSQFADAVGAIIVSLTVDEHQQAVAFCGKA